MRPSQRARWLVIFCALAGLGCQRAPEDPGTDSNTNWLESCESAAQCENPYSCLCGVCTLTCSTAGDCGNTPEASECRSADEQNGCPTALCLPVNSAKPASDGNDDTALEDDDGPGADDDTAVASDDTSNGDDMASADDDALTDDDAGPVASVPVSTVPVPVNCPPCVPPPSPLCVGEGPCGCGPYVCPDEGSGGTGASMGGASNGSGGSAGGGDAGGGNGVTISSPRLPPECDLAPAQDCQCLDDADCEPGTVCYYSNCTAELAGGCETPPAEGNCWADRDCRDDQVCLDGAFPVCDTTTRESLGTCSVMTCGELGVPCGAGEVCVLIETGALAISESWECVANPCLGEPLDCTCANPICESVGSECASVGPIEGREYTSDVYCPSLQRCASPDTPIATPSGNRPIASLEPGDLVYTLDDFGVRAVPLLEVRSSPARNHSVLRIRFDNGAEWRISARHPTADGRLLLDLDPGESIHEETIVSIEEIPFEFERTYDILPASPSGVYFADGVAVGSTLLRHAVTSP